MADRFMEGEGKRQLQRLAPNSDMRSNYDGFAEKDRTMYSKKSRRENRKSVATGGGNGARKADRNP